MTQQEVSVASVPSAKKYINIFFLWIIAENKACCVFDLITEMKMKMKTSGRQL